MASPKRKSEMRWEQGRRLYGVVCPSLPSPSHIAVLMFCWFHASGKECCFSAAHIQIAKGTALSYERVRKIMSELVAGGVVITTEDSTGRGRAPQRQITGRPYKSKKVVAHDHHTEQNTNAGVFVVAALRKPPARPGNVHK